MNYYLPGQKKQWKDDRSISFWRGVVSVTAGFAVFFGFLLYFLFFFALLIIVAWLRSLWRRGLKWYRSVTVNYLMSVV